PAYLLGRGQQQAEQDANDGNDDQQLDQRESMAGTSHQEPPSQSASTSGCQRKPPLINNHTTAEGFGNNRRSRVRRSWSLYPRPVHGYGMRRREQSLLRPGERQPT